MSKDSSPVDESLSSTPRDTSENMQVMQVMQVTLISSILGCMVGIGICGWSCIDNSLAPLSLYLSFIALFHLSEFFAINWTQSPKLISTDSFLLDNGPEYVAALILPAIEYAIEWRIIRGLKMFKLLRFTGIILVIGGETLRLWTIMHAGHSFTHIVATYCSPVHRLVTTGPYHRLRHPAYAGFYAWALGLQILLANPLSFAAYAVILSNFFSNRVQAEEKALLDRFGADYLIYRRKTVSGIPFLD